MEQLIERYVVAFGVGGAPATDRTNLPWRGDILPDAT
jgi:hypothetical protein